MTDDLLISERLAASTKAPECAGCMHLVTDKDGDHLCRLFQLPGGYVVLATDARQSLAPCGPSGVFFKRLDS